MYDAVIPFCTYNPPYIDALALVTNPLLGEIDAVNEPDFNTAVSNAKFEILILYNPLPSPLNTEPDANTTSAP